MSGKMLAAVTIALLPLAGPLTAAPQPEVQAPVVVVGGLAKDDLLNIRATASATGMVIGRLPNGSALKNLGCDEINGYKWCKIAAVDDDKVNGWTPARYLQGVADDAPTVPAASGTAAENADSPELAPEMGAGDMPDLPAESPIPTPSPAALVVEAEQPMPPPVQVASSASVVIGTPSAPAESSALPPDLSARLGAASVSTEAGVSLIESDTVASAFQTAYAVPATDAAAPFDGTVSTGSIERPAPLVPAKPVAQPPAVAIAVPPPAPSVAAQLKPMRAASIPQPASLAPADATGEIPCARYIGQAMTRCAAAVARTGTEDADVTVTLPDGGRRTIRFRAGMPEGSNSRGAFRFTREGDLNMVRVGTSERFEIPDALAFGD